ncbi:MAG: hypothetical protein LC749_14745 [Actinobacteria bacterium]|nr:hypothetical protein [Actinomycetota bacterium]
MTTKTAPKIVIKKAAAAAIVTSANLPAALTDKVDTSTKFVVHPHVAIVSTNDALLHGYLRSIYSTRKPLETAYPAAAAFAKLKVANSVEQCTRTLAQALVETMGKKNANPGILFGFMIGVDGQEAHGVIKADLDDEQRFHFESSASNTWTLSAVRDILPPPKTEYAKFVIAPQPTGTGAAGVRDMTDTSAAADYFLEAVELVVPRTSGTQAAIAQAALEAGYTHEQVRSVFDGMEESTAVETVIQNDFPKIPQKRQARLIGTAARPMREVRKNDPYLRVYRTTRPRFELVVDDQVEVQVEGRRIIVTLPQDSEPLIQQTRIR